DPNNWSSSATWTTSIVANTSASSINHIAPANTDDLHFGNLATINNLIGTQLAQQNLKIAVSDSNGNPVPYGYTSTDNLSGQPVNTLSFDGIASLADSNGKAIPYTIAMPTGMSNVITVNGLVTSADSSGIAIGTRNQATFAANPNDNSKLTVTISPQVNFANG